MTDMAESEADFVNLLILGQTGIGKSTFINAFFNYWTYDSLDDALEGGVKVAIPSIVVKREQYEETEFRVGENISGQEEDLDGSFRGESATQVCKAHVFKLKDNSMTVRLIDTPGVGDTRGFQQDRENFKDILNTMTKYKNIHGICILLKPDEPRLHTYIGFCLSELLTYFHKSAVDNFAFCFTNCRYTDFKLRSTLGPLQKLRNSLKETTGVEIPINEQTLYFFDNEVFPALAARHHNFELSTGKEDLERSWERSVEEMTRLLKRFSTITPHRTEASVSVNKVKQIVRNLEEPMNIITQNIGLQQKFEEEQIELIQQFDEEITDAQKLLMTSRKVEFLPLDHWRLVCTNPPCVEIVQTNGLSTFNYPKLCHAICKEMSVRFCSVMTLQGTCTRCKHDYSKHRQINFETVIKYVENREIREAIEKGMTNKELKTLALQSTKKSLEEWTQEKDVIDETSVQFAAFLKNSTITPFNEYVIQYLELSIAESKNNDKDYEQFEIELENCREEKKKYERFLEKVEKMHEISVESIRHALARLMDLPKSGTHFKPLARIEDSAEAKDPRETLYELSVPDPVMANTRPYTDARPVSLKSALRMFKNKLMANQLRR
ncbi:hypothetical protein MPTK1_8g13510 [Marchantia polymorpha subsp. ruderalis]|uniref:DUF8206 domain-containing protein n=1 Tax=Marchantia polymorpha TaxID=3197 RepID=A0A2R6WCG7_MARPO|nr:hypothetical protein MARPO_0110s0037 [Marchantia polymorpha]PTQ31547.1 hypothetical protein MARPO_0110s0037 [Marchantia polymorpha]BBN19774.1 hypothetical protein Mp_8g13510 [Marchantia polymorpha subsp. ruderalis]BBN19775.1 hypothetical protein Mp_8g13510 [Marchantia polymorpha subsp. ruderalis]|eukprot:PTQ31546.1 hypothetical protein MARPO_0110s0037 [Marchantia polymorpha]